ncbi:hypothetical protein AB0H57_10420 [Micromonospora sp. NPDC050686]|uniref:hypothetical protein n=1 Tax=Micromonospora sp. NPDC050686 TaxID=3154631 RepID=UPI0033D81D89
MSRTGLSRPSTYGVWFGAALVVIGAVGYTWPRLSSGSVRAGFDVLTGHWHVSLVVVGILGMIFSLGKQIASGLKRLLRPALSLLRLLVRSIQARSVSLMLGVLIVVVIGLAVDKTHRFEFYKSLVWPAIVLTIVLIFRSSLTNLIDQIDQGEGWGLRFSRRIGEARRRSEEFSSFDRPESQPSANDAETDGRAEPSSEEQTSPQGNNVGPGDDEATYDPLFGADADDLHPALVVISRWEAIRREAQSIAEEFPEVFGPKNTRSYANPSFVARRLAKANLVSRDLPEVLDALRAFRNSVAHANRLDIEHELALDYDASARNIVAALQQAKKRLIAQTPG